MDKTEALSRLVFCEECVYWHCIINKEFKEEYRDYMGYCNRPYQAIVTRFKDDFCSNGRKKNDY